MKRFLIIATALLLSISSWGQVLAAALCPHMQREHACCLAKDSRVAQHDQVISHNDGAMDGMEMTPTTPAAEEDANTITGPMGSCGHCMDRSEQPVGSFIVSRTVDQSRQELRAAPAQALQSRSLLSASFTPPIASRQNAPPGDQSPRHVLINVFRI